MTNTQIKEKASKVSMEIEKLITGDLSDSRFNAYVGLVDILNIIAYEDNFDKYKPIIDILMKNDDIYATTNFFVDMAGSFNTEDIIDARIQACINTADTYVDLFLKGE